MLPTICEECKRRRYTYNASVVYQAEIEDQQTGWLCKKHFVEELREKHNIDIAECQECNTWPAKFRLEFEDKKIFVLCRDCFAKVVANKLEAGELRNNVNLQRFNIDFSIEMTVSFVEVFID